MTNSVSRGNNFYGSPLFPPFAYLLALCLMVCCSTNPATGRQSFTGFMTASEEAQIGRKADPQIIEAFGGLYDNAALAAYVNQVGQRVAATAERTDLRFTFRVLNTPIANALASPGGYVYVTRGLLALVDNEAELAAVLGHEIGHIEARHHAQAYSRQALAQLGLGLLAGATGQPALVQGTQILAVGFLRSFSRQEELEADTLGVRYTARAGYAPRAIAGFLQTMEAYKALQAKLLGAPPQPSALYDFFATHPTTAARFEEVLRAAKVAAVSEPVVGRDRYLGRINGLLYGNSPKEGLIRGRLYLHPGMRIAFEAPVGFHLLDTPKMVYAIGPQNAAIAFDRAAGGGAASALQYLTATWARQVPLSDVRQFKSNGAQVATGVARASSNIGPVDLRLVAVRRDARYIYRFRFVTPVAITRQLTPGLWATVGSLRPLSAQEAASLKPLRVRIVTVKRGQSVADFAQRCAFERFPEEQFRVLNGLSSGARLTPGQQVKIVTE